MKADFFSDLDADLRFSSQRYFACFGSDFSLSPFFSWGYPHAVTLCETLFAVFSTRKICLVVALKLAIFLAGLVTLDFQDFFFCILFRCQWLIYMQLINNMTTHLWQQFGILIMYKKQDHVFNTGIVT